MLEAKSMYFGGEIISASECDYQTSRELGLVCPFCSSAVFVRSESTRQIKGKLRLIRPYFAHYPSGSAGNWDCEKRSHTKQGRELIEQVRIQARGQRLDLYSKHLWEMFSRDRNVSRRKLAEFKALLGHRWCDRQLTLLRKKWTQSIEIVYKFLDAVLIEFESQKEIPISDRPSWMTAASYQEELDKQNQYFLGCDRRLHRAICFEIVDFLGTNTGGFAFSKFMVAGLWLEFMSDRPLAALKLTDEATMRLHLSAIAGLIAGTHWMTQISKMLEGGDRGIKFG